ncbi:MAG: hypothetical protein AABX48_01440 [Nanoarchaeota archaeon]
MEFEPRDKRIVGIKTPYAFELKQRYNINYFPQFLVCSKVDGGDGTYVLYNPINLIDGNNGLPVSLELPTTEIEHITQLPETNHEFRGEINNPNRSFENFLEVVSKNKSIVEMFFE